jgi:hypothetical protein
MNLGQAQRAFTLCVADLIRHAYSLGYEMTFGDAYRDPRVNYGHPKSTHRFRLAVDLNLFKDGVWLKKTEDHRVLGEWWELQHPLAKWGGRFEDGNHYSFEWDGVA